MSQETLNFIQERTGIRYSDEQAALVSCKGGACVLACAGSGKTTALTHLIARRLKDKDVTSGRRILGVTFSRTGAAEMDERLEDLLELLDISADVKMKTLHAFCLEFLKSIGSMSGRSVISEGEKLEALQKIGRSTRSWKYENAEAISGLITLQRGSLCSREDFLNTIDFRCSDIESLKYNMVYDGYKAYKAENNLIDFDDMLLLAHFKLKQSDFYGSDFMNRYQCVLVDEAQDMSKLQYRIVLQLLGKNAVSEEEHIEHVKKTLVLIGDDDQCQPSDTVITMYDKSFKMIQDLKIGDEVLSGALGVSEIEYAAGKVEQVSKRTVDSVIQVTTQDGRISCYTDNHHCLVTLDYAAGKLLHAVCLLRNAQGWFQIGTVKLFAQKSKAVVLGLGQKMRINKATEAWILQVTDTAGEATTLSKICSKKYNIPRLTWYKGSAEYPGLSVLESVYNQIPNLQESAQQCLADYNRNIEYPVLCSDDNQLITARNIVKLRACNLLEGCMSVVTYSNVDGKFQSSLLTDIKILTGDYTVYGLKVSDHHTYVADDILTHNCIYEWMGSEPQELNKLRLAYDLPLYQLSTNYRCPANVLSAAARCIQNNTHSIEKSMNAHKPDGVFSFEYVSGGFSCESRFVADSIVKQLAAGVEPSTISVLARNGVHLSLVWLYLSCYGIKSRMYGGQSSGPDNLVKHILGCFRLYTSMADAGNMLYALFGGNKKSSEKLATLINMVDGTFVEWLEYMLGKYMPQHKEVLSADNAYKESGKAWKQAMDDFYFQGEFTKKSFTMDHIRKLYYAANESFEAYCLTVLDCFGVAMEWKYKTEDSLRIFKGTLEALSFVIKSMPDKAIPMLTTLDKHRAPNKNYVTLSTAHSAKGREWNTVYMVCDDVLSFPSQLSIDILTDMGDRRAVEHYIEAERRLHYVAMTRAKEALYIIGGENPMGMFLQEALDADYLNA